MWFVSLVKEICLLCFVNSEITMWLDLESDFDGTKWEDQSLSSFLSNNFQKFLGHLRLFAFSDILPLQDLWVAESNYFSKNPSVIQIWPELSWFVFWQMLSYLTFIFPFHGTRKRTCLIAWPLVVEVNFSLQWRTAWFCFKEIIATYFSYNISYFITTWYKN